MREELERSEDSWANCHSNARDPEELYNEKKKEWEIEKANEEKSEKSSLGFMGGLFGKKKEPESYGKKKTDKKKEKFKS